MTQIDILLCFKKFLPISESPETLSCPEYRHKMLQKLGVLFDGEYDTNHVKVECVFPMVISSDFRVGQHRDDDYQEDAPHLI